MKGGIGVSIFSADWHSKYRVSYALFTTFSRSDLNYQKAMRMTLNSTVRRLISNWNGSSVSARRPANTVQDKVASFAAFLFAK